ncbi:MAG: hypothetical protein U0527_02405 [Candidatus Eisenbacteria bacterium]
MKNSCVTLVEPKQIAKKGYQGCKSTKTVVQFARKYGVPTLWWKPSNGQKVLLIEPTQFGQTWKQVQGGKNNTKPMRAHGTTNGTKRTNNTRGTSYRANGTSKSTAYGKNTSYGKSTSNSKNKSAKMSTGTKRWTMSRTTTRRTTKGSYRRAA